MATIPGVTTFPESRTIRVVWTAVTETDTFGVSKVSSRTTGRTVAVTGTFGTTTILIVGSLDDTTYVTLSGDAAPLSFTAPGVARVLEDTPYIKALRSGGTTESVTVVLTGVMI